MRNKHDNHNSKKAKGHLKRNQTQLTSNKCICQISYATNHFHLSIISCISMITNKPFTLIKFQLKKKITWLNSNRYRLMLQSNIVLQCKIINDCQIDATKITFDRSIITVYNGFQKYLMFYSKKLK